jgi:putative ABC transport system permease protein
MAEMISEMTGTLINVISLVLIAFAAISLIVSTIMIGIITYVSVIERTKEIGILRSVGARKKDISRVFNAEALIIGFTAGGIGVLLAYLISIPANIIIGNLAGISGIMALNPIYAVLLIGGSMLLTLIAGFIPSRMAAKKDPVEALRTE